MSSVKSGALKMSALNTYTPRDLNLSTEYLKQYTVEPVSKIDKTKILMTNGSLMKVQCIAECSPWSILQYF